MNPSWNETATEEDLHERMLRGRKRLSEQQQVLTLWYGRRNTSQIAQQLGWSRDKVMWLLHVLGLETKKGKREGEGLGRWPMEPKGVEPT